MFTLLPSLYLIGVRCFQHWNNSYYNESNKKELIEINNKTNNPITSVQQDTSSSNIKVKSRKKKPHYRRRTISLSGLTQDDIAYLMKRTGLTEDDILLWYREFLNDCPDGKLAKDKFINIYQQFYKRGHVNKFCEHAFQLFDKDRSGFMDFMEFLLAVSLTSTNDPVRKIDLFFAMYDIDHNGLIDENETRSFVESIYELLGIDISDPSRIDTKVHNIFSKAECDQSGHLTKDQFATACQNDRYIRKLLIPNTKLSNN